LTVVVEVLVDVDVIVNVDVLVVCALGHECRSGAYCQGRDLYAERYRQPFQGAVAGSSRSRSDATSCAGGHFGGGCELSLGETGSAPQCRHTGTERVSSVSVAARWLPLT
jgi:hypothetical protein